MTGDGNLTVQGTGAGSMLAEQADVLFAFGFWLSSTRMLATSAVAVSSSCLLFKAHWKVTAGWGASPLVCRIFYLL